MKFLKTLIGAVSFAAMAAAAYADGPAIIYDLGGKFDKSFNEAAYNGAERFKAESGVEYKDFEMQSEAQREQALERFARTGSNPVVAVGFAWASAMETVAPKFPDTSFTIIDMVVGFIGGMDIPLIRKFACGYVQGVKAVNPDAEVFQNMTGTTPSAWNDPVKGSELTKSQIDRGADVVYHAAGGTGRGVLQAAADAGALGIGVDSNQNHMHPGSVLTSMLKRVDVAVYNAFKDVADGNFTAGFSVLGLKEDGVGWALDDNNASLVSDDMKTAVEAAKGLIIAGDTKVHDYMSDSSCPVN